MRVELSKLEKRLREVQLMVNLEMAEVVLFTRKYKTSPVLGLKLFGKEVKVLKATMQYEGSQKGPG